MRRWARGAAVLGCSVVLVPAGAEAQMLLAEYVGEAPGVKMRVSAQGGAVDSEAVTASEATIPATDPPKGDRFGLAAPSVRLPVHALDPPGLAGYTLGETLRPPVRLGGTTSGLLDAAYGRVFLWGRPYGRAGVLTVGPRFSFTPRTTTYFYYRQVWDDPIAEPGADGPGPPGRRVAAGAGVSQLWRMTGRGGELRFGYEYVLSRADAGSAWTESHRLNLSSRIPLLPKLSARVEADYSRHIFAELDAAADVGSYRREFRAAVSGWLGGRFQARLIFGYLEEGPEPDLFSERRSIWGLNFSYTY